MKIEQSVQHSNTGDVGAAIAAVARSHFRRFGYARTSMKEIAEDCRMSVANLYRYYDGKLAIGAAVTAAEQSALFADCDRAAGAAPDDLVAKLIALFQSLIEGTHRQIRSTPFLFELGMVVARERPEHRQRILRETEARIAAILAADGSGRTGVEISSRLILLACAPFVLPWMLRTQPFGNPRSYVEPLIRCLVAGLATASPPDTTASAALAAQP